MKILLLIVALTGLGVSATHATSNCLLTVTMNLNSAWCRPPQVYQRPADCPVRIGDYYYTGACLLGDWTNCNFVYGVSPPNQPYIAVSMYADYSTPTEIGTFTIGCINGHGDSQTLIVPAHETIYLFFPKASCDAAGCHLTIAGYGGVTGSNCGTSSSTNAPPQD